MFQRGSDSIKVLKSNHIVQRICVDLIGFVLEEIIIISGLSVYSDYIYSVVLIIKYENTHIRYSELDIKGKENPWF